MAKSLKFNILLICLFGFAAASLANEVPHISVDLGDDYGEWANNNVCDDPRFEGIGVDEYLTPDDIGRDATDCRLAYEIGNIRLNPDYIAFGDNNSDWANDGQCDDPRFFIDSDANPIHLEEDIATDADDCFSAYAAKRIQARVILRKGEID